MIRVESDLVKAMGQVMIHHSFALASSCVGKIPVNAVLQRLKLGGQTYC